MFNTTFSKIKNFFSTFFDWYSDKMAAFLEYSEENSEEQFYG